MGISAWLYICTFFPCSLNMNPESPPFQGLSPLIKQPSEHQCGILPHLKLLFKRLQNEADSLKTSTSVVKYFALFEVLCQGSTTCYSECLEPVQRDNIPFGIPGMAPQLKSGDNNSYYWCGMCGTPRAFQQFSVKEESMISYHKAVRQWATFVNPSKGGSIVFCTNKCKGNDGHRSHHSSSVVQTFVPTTTCVTFSSACVNKHLQCYSGSSSECLCRHHQKDGIAFFGMPGMTPRLAKLWKQQFLNDWELIGNESCQLSSVVQQQQMFAALIQKPHKQKCEARRYSQLSHKWLTIVDEMADAGDFVHIFCLQSRFFAKQECRWPTLEVIDFTYSNCRGTLRVIHQLSATGESVNTGKAKHSCRSVEKCKLSTEAHQWLTFVAPLSEHKEVNIDFITRQFHDQEFMNDGACYCYSQSPLLIRDSQLSALSAIIWPTSLANSEEVDIDFITQKFNDQQVQEFANDGLNATYCCYSNSSLNSQLSTVCAIWPTSLAIIETGKEFGNFAAFNDSSRSDAPTPHDQESPTAKSGDSCSAKSVGVLSLHLQSQLESSGPKDLFRPDNLPSQWSEVEESLMSPIKHFRAEAGGDDLLTEDEITEEQPHLMRNDGIGSRSPPMTRDSRVPPLLPPSQQPTTEPAFMAQAEASRCSELAESGRSDVEEGMWHEDSTTTVQAVEESNAECDHSCCVFVSTPPEFLLVPTVSPFITPADCDSCGVLEEETPVDAAAANKISSSIS